jgi:hypothetical protein
MGLWQDVRDFVLQKSDKCQSLWSRDSRKIFFKGIGGGFSEFKASIGEFSTEVEKVREANEMTIALDDYQVNMCRIAHDFDKGSNERARYQEIRAGAILLITKARVVLEAYRADQQGQRNNLFRIVQRMIDYEDASFERKKQEIIEVSETVEVEVPSFPREDRPHPFYYPTETGPRESRVIERQVRRRVKARRLWSSVRRVKTENAYKAMKIAGVTKKQIRQLEKKI